jgi:hypothetical protein
MSKGYHPEIDESPLCIEDESTKYTSIICCCICILIIVLGRLDTAYATFAMSRFNMLPREEHLTAVQIILSYFMTFIEGRVIIDTSYPEHYMYTVDDHSNRIAF